MIPEEFVRIITKSTTVPGEVPTVPVDETDLNGFISTDIFEAELFYNIPDEILYTRTGATVVNLNNIPQITTTSVSVDTVVTGFDIYEITGSGSVLMTLPPSSTKEITFKKMDTGGAVTFTEDIDGNPSFQLDTLDESVGIVWTGTQWIITSYYLP